MTSKSRNADLGFSACAVGIVIWDPAGSILLAANRKRVCGADADTIVARNLLRAIAAGQPPTLTTDVMSLKRCFMLPRGRRRITRLKIGIN